MDENRDLAYQEEVIKGTAGTMYAGTHFPFCQDHIDLLIESSIQLVLIRCGFPKSIPESISLTCM